LASAKTTAHAYTHLYNCECLDFVTLHTVQSSATITDTELNHYMHNWLQHRSPSSFTAVAPRSDLPCIIEHLILIQLITSLIQHILNAYILELSCL